LRNDKVILIKEVENLKTIGETYEVANIVDNLVILRDATSKMAVGAIDISIFEEHFKKPEEVKGWTEWQRMLDNLGNTLGFYRTNFKKVQVRTMNGIRSEATCNKKYDDGFNLFFGIQLAFTRCADKFLRLEEDKYETLIEEYKEELNKIRSNRIDNKNMRKKMLSSLNKVEE
jgi:hypothetical protein